MPGVHQLARTLRRPRSWHRRGREPGLIGLGERLALVGGDLQHGTNAMGDFVLRATTRGAP